MNISKQNPPEEAHLKKCPDSLSKKDFFKLRRYIIISATKLEMNDMALATACTIFNKFYMFCQIKDFDPYLVATSCLYLSIKTNEQEGIKLRDIINVCYNTRHPEPLELDEKYWALRQSVTQTELMIVRALGFKLDFNHPHKYLLQYLDSLSSWIGKDNLTPLAAVAWQILRDLLHTDICMKYGPQEQAIAIIYFVANCYGVKVPFNEYANVKWWQALYDRVDLNMINDIVNEIIEAYEYEHEISEELDTCI